MRLRNPFTSDPGDRPSQPAVDAPADDDNVTAARKRLSVNKWWEPGAPDQPIDASPEPGAPVGQQADAAPDQDGAVVRSRSERSADNESDSPSDLSSHEWSSAFGGTIGVFKTRKLTRWAAALTYYGVLALFPALIAAVSMLGLIGSSAIQPLLDNLTTAAPGPARDLLEQALVGIQNNAGASGITFAIGLALALWAASGYVGAFMDASNDIYAVDEGRSIWKKIPRQLAITVVELVLISACAIAVLLTGDLAQRAGEIFAVGDTAVDIWNIAKWPAMLVVFSFALALLYWASPNIEHPNFRFVTPGSLLAIVSWIAVSAAFALYVANFGSYNKTYGALGGVVVFLIWLWISNVVVLLGAALNAQLEEEA